MNRYEVADATRWPRWCFLDVFARGAISDGRSHARRDGGWNPWGIGVLEVNSTYCDTVDIFARPIEDLMLDVLMIQLSAGRQPALPEQLQLERIHRVIALHGLETLLGELPTIERREFERDLFTIGVVGPWDGSKFNAMQCMPARPPIAQAVLDEPRWTHERFLHEIIWRCVDACRAKALPGGRWQPWQPGELAVSHAHAALEGSFERPIEQLMLDVIALVFAAGRFTPSAEERLLARVQNLIAEHTLRDLLELLSNSEREEFERDLRAHGLIPDPRWVSKPGDA